MTDKKLYEVPFTFTMKGSVFVMAASPEEASDNAAEKLGFDSENLAESCLFFDPSDADRIEIEPTPEGGNPQVEFTTPILSEREASEFDYTTSNPITQDTN